MVTHDAFVSIQASLGRLLSLSLACSLLACAPTARPAPVTPAPQPVAPAAPVPTGRLPEGVRPLGYTLELTVSPAQDRFSGRTQITVAIDAPTQLVWLHGRGLSVSSARALLGGASIPASYTQVNDDGVVALHFASVLPAGSAVLEIVYDAAFDRQLRGLFRVDVAGESYAFTQFEAVSARQAFPSFDEPRFKTPFDVWLTVPADLVAAANTRPLAEEAVAEGWKRVHFDLTKPLPTYLVAFAVGRFDVVEAASIPPNAVRAEPLPLRGIAVRGKGAQLAQALATTGPMVSWLEGYFGIPYPYDKLDLVAVPDFGPGAMENAGLITFREWLLLLDREHASETQRRASASVIAHELAHQWFGNLVTMYWWDDIWLNEAFATWMGHRVVAQLHPEHRADLALLAGIEHAMHTDSLVSARRIREPVNDTHDISNAFDSITYSKGGGVLAMFERFLGRDAFQQGVRNYLSARPFGNATSEDLLAALSESAGRDVVTPFMSFLNQVGVPLVTTELSCAEGQTPELRLSQSRYLPLGSTGDPRQVWQIPLCVRYESAGALRETCTLLTDAEGTLALPGAACPSWVMPNADGAGYYRFALSGPEIEKLVTRGMRRLSAAERFVLVHALHAGFSNGSIGASDVLTAHRTFAADSERLIATAPMRFLQSMRDTVVPEAQRPAVEAYSRELYLPLKNRLGFRDLRNEDGDTKLLRASVLGFLAEVGRDQPTRTRAQRMGRQYLGLGADDRVHPDAVAADLADLAVRMVVEEGDAATWDAIYERFTREQDPLLRGRLLRALASVHDPARSQRARELTLDPQLRVNEVLMPLRAQLGDPHTRQAAWEWFEQNFDAVAQRVPSNAAASTPWLATSFCSLDMAARVETFFGPRVAQLSGGPRSLAGAVEALRLCAAVAETQTPSLSAFFGRR